MIQSEASARQPASGLLDDLRIEPLTFNIPEFQRYELSDGSILFVLPDSSLPAITLEFEFDSGKSSEMIEQAGQLSALTSLMSLGGAADRSADEMANAISRIGARVSVEASSETWTVSLSVLSRHFEDGFSLISDIIAAPELPEDRLEVIKSSMHSSIQQRNNRPEDIAGRKLIELMYDGNPEGYTLQPEDIDNITIADIRANYDKRLAERDLMISVSGDISETEIDELVEKIESLIARLPEKVQPTETRRQPAGHRIPPLSESQSRHQGKIYLVVADVDQAAIRIGHHMPAHSHHEFFALQVGNYVLGGGSFNSRLMQEVRGRRGLAYYAYSRNSFFRDRGRFIAGSGTRIDAAVTTLRLMQSIIHNIRDGVSGRELNLAREAIVNSTVFLYESPSGLLSNEKRFIRNGMGENYLQHFPQRIGMVSGSDVREAFENHLSNPGMYTVIVGPESLKADLEAIAPVVMIQPEQIDHLQFQTNNQ